MLRFVTYLAPSLPRDLFELVTEHVGRALGTPVSLAVDSELSGPAPDRPDPFSTDEFDVGFICAPSFARLRELVPPPVVAVAAPVFAGEGVGDRPVYFADVVVRRDHPARTLDDLTTARWGYNDASSLSGYHSLPAMVDRLSAVHTGSHLRSLAMVMDGELDAAAIDSVVLGLRRGDDARVGEELRVVARLGPFPVQPVVAAARLPVAQRDRLRAVLLTLHDDARAAADLHRYGLRRFAPVDAADYRMVAARD